jgi:hypothetical protein
MYRGTYGSASRLRRRYHRLGIIIAATVMAIGLAVSAAGMVRLELWEVLQEDTLAIVLGFALIALAAICLAVYGVVRAIGWVIKSFAA